MSEIDFLGNKNEDDQKPKDKDDKRDEIIWSDPEKQTTNPKSGLSSFFPLLSGKSWAKAPVGLAARSAESRRESRRVKPGQEANDKNKIKESRREILKLIKHHENSAAGETRTKAPGKNFLTAWGEKLNKQKNHKDILIDYQQVFNQEKDRRSSSPPNSNIRPEEKKQTSSSIKAAGDSWLAKLLKLIRQKLSAFKMPKVRPVLSAGSGIKGINLAPKPEPDGPAVKAEPKPIAMEKSEVKTEIKAVPTGAESEVKKEVEPAKKEPATKRQALASVLETNLIKGEIIAYFDWRQKIVSSVFVILIPIFLVGAIYTGLAFYQKTNQTKTQEQIRKYGELVEKIKREEVDLGKISNFQVRLKTISQIFSGHIYWTNFFKFLEDNTIKDVYYTGFTGDTGGTYTLDAYASSYGNISEQAKALRDNPRVTDVQAGGGELTRSDEENKTKIKFSFKFSVLKSLFTE